MGSPGYEAKSMFKGATNLCLSQVNTVAKNVCTAKQRSSLPVARILQNPVYTPDRSTLVLGCGVGVIGQLRRKM